jgi:hypothetical protein
VFTEAVHAAEVIGDDSDAALRPIASIHKYLRLRQLRSELVFDAEMRRSLRRILTTPSVLICCFANLWIGVISENNPSPWKKV